jgi:hypothetical protein
MKLNLLAKAKSYSTLPYPHICISDALPIDIYDELESTFPEELVCDTPALDGGITHRYKSNQALFNKEIPQIWKDFFYFHTSQEYFRSCIRLFEPYLEINYPNLLDLAMKSAVTVRNVNNSGHFVTDCQYVVHEPVDQSGTSRTPHLDNPVEIYAGLLYMRNPLDTSKGGNFTLHQVTYEIQEVHKKLGRAVPKHHHNPVAEIPYERNTFCMFLNVKNSVHSVTPRIQPKFRRRSVNIIGEFNNNGAMWNIQESN